jgi:AsmA family protein
MKASLVVRRCALLTFAVGAALIIMTAALFAAVDAGYGRSLLIRYFALRIGRPVQVSGTLQAHMFSLNPRVVAEGVTIGNPPWMPTGLAAEVGKITVILALPRAGHPSGIAELEMEAATLYLVRDVTGHANWQLADPSKHAAHKNSSIVRNLSIPNAHVVLGDALRHLQFVGTVSMHAPSGPGSGQPLRIDGTGQLNGRAVSFNVTADPLGTASHENPYHFTFAERSSGSRVEARGFLSRPFDFNLIDAAFEATGPDLKDLYFLTGVRLLDTGCYHLTGKVSRRGTHTEYSNLVATSGQTDVRGNVAIDSSSARPKLALDLNSQVLHLSDLGIRAAGRTFEPESQLLLSNAVLSPHVLRISDATVRFRATTVDLGRLPLHDVSVKAVIDRGVLTVAPLLAEVLGGHVNAHLTLDARKDVPAANVDLKITDLQLGNFFHKDLDKPPIAGLMQVRVIVTGAGSSVHEVAASANGTVRAQLPHGAIRASIAEFTSGVDLRGLGLLLTHNEQEIPIHCAIASFKAEAGTLIAQNMVADTDPVLITGEGRIHLDSEALELVIHGHPKSLRFFRLRAPLLVRGTLAHPSINIQRNEAIPLIVDRGRANDAACAALLVGINSVGAPAHTPR